MKEKLKKIDFLTLGAIIIVTTLLCNTFLQMHYSSDTFVLIDLGYMEYPSQYFLLDGRLISTLICYIAGILHIPYETYIIGMDFIAIILVSISIYIMYKTITKIINSDGTFKKALILMSSFVLILNQFSLEYLLFPESAVMCLGELLCVIAATKVISADKHKYLKIFILLLFSVFCYQGLINIFPILSITLIFLNQINNKITIKQNVMEFIKKILPIIFICILILAINILTIKISNKLLNNSSYRTIQLHDLESILIRLKTIKVYLDMIWNSSLDMMPKHINSVIIALTIFLLLLNKATKETLFKYIFTILTIIIVCVVPMFFFNTGPCGRVNIPICQTLGISLLFLLKSIDNHIAKNLIKSIIYGLIIVIFVLNSVMILRNSNEHITANKVDENMGAIIKYLVDKYENETGIKVTKFSYIYDSDPQQYAPGIRHIGSLTERKLSCSWCISQAMNYYCQRKFEKVKMPIDIYIEKIPKKDYTGFSEEQVIFDNDTLYLYVF